MHLSIITATYNRPEELRAIALPSLLCQTDNNFEWVVVNDGGNSEVKEIIEGLKLKAKFSINYVEIEHNIDGCELNDFGLCHARNAGLSIANGDLISYLDDDNSLYPEFVAQVKTFFQENHYVKYSMVLQNRRRDIVDKGITRKGKSFISPSSSCSLEELVTQHQIFDSNGFTHHKQNSPKWNPDYRIFADYEFLLQCINRHGRDKWKLNPQILVNYIQSSEGIIGSSTYREWGIELNKIIENKSSYQFNLDEVERLLQLKNQYFLKTNQRINAFVDRK